MRPGCCIFDRVLLACATCLTGPAPIGGGRLLEEPHTKVLLRGRWNQIQCGGGERPEAGVTGQGAIWPSFVAGQPSEASVGEELERGDGTGLIG
jgi:hypothetical protein